MDLTPEIKLKRYLHYASEDGVYSPGCRFHFKNYTPEKLSCLNELVSEGKEQFILDSIKKVHQEKTSPYPEAIIFALAQCVRDKTSTPLRIDAYKLAETICSSSEYLFTFFKFTFEPNPKSGSGRACKRFVKNWYMRKKALELAEMVAQRPKYKGWSHADILAISHIKSNEKDKAAVFKYIVKGLEEAQREFGSEPEAAEVLEYLSNVSNFRKNTDSISAARKIESYMLSIDHVNFSLLKNKEVWTALLRNMRLPALLNHLQWLSKNGMFRHGPAWHYEFIKDFCDALSNPASIADSGIHPSRAFIELCTYKNAARVKLELAVKLDGKPVKQPPTPCVEIIDALGKVIRSSFQSIVPTGLSYVIAVDVSETMTTRRCGHCRYVNTAQAASLITLCYLKAEKNVDVMVFSQNQPSLLKPVTIPVESTIEETQTLLQKAGPGGPVDVTSLFSWALETKKKVDIFLILSTYVKQGTYPHHEKPSPSSNSKVHSILEDLRKYSLVAETPNTRVVLCNLGGTPKQAVCVESSNFLTVSGFDDKVCKVIEAFAKGAF